MNGYPLVKTKKRSSDKICEIFGRNQSFLLLFTPKKKLVKTKAFAGHRIFVRRSQVAHLYFKGKWEKLIPKAKTSSLTFKIFKTSH